MSTVCRASSTLDRRNSARALSSARQRTAIAPDRTVAVAEIAAATSLTGESTLHHYSSAKRPLGTLRGVETCPVALGARGDLDGARGAYSESQAATRAAEPARHHRPHLWAAPLGAWQSGHVGGAKNTSRERIQAVMG